ncbi:acyl-CoA carboxylase epsilon subunit [Rothia mucilaginosa]|uniref:acyl-CoA carboxylase subunit epsilon n=1 Tax=Rothia mucilaginosa TaxID=43675 RepID=UPI0036F22B28
MPLAGYNPLSYFSFGKKKDSSEAAESTEQLERSSARSSAHADTASSAAKDSAQSSVDTDAEQEPLLKVVKGSPTPEEIAALTAVVAMMQASAAKQEQNLLVGAASRILNRGQRLGVSLRPGPGSWRRARPM